MAELELPKVPLQVLRGNPHVSPVDAALQRSPKAFDGVGMDLTANVFLLGVVNPLMLVAVNIQVPICLALVGMDAAAFDDPLLNDGDNVLHAAASDLTHKNLTTALNHAQDDVLV